jgi:hypothetical protein
MRWCRAAASYWLVALATLVACEGKQGILLHRLDAGTDVADATGGAAGNTSRWSPEPSATWQIQLSGTIDTLVDASFYIVDVDTAADIATEFHASGRRLACFFSAGSLEKFRSDAARFPASVIGKALPNYPDERWLDIRDSSVESLMIERIQAAKDAGCDGVQPANIASYTADTGFALTESDQLAFNRALTQAAHARGLAIGLPDGSAAFAALLLADFDWVMEFDCANSGCGVATTFSNAGKAGFVVLFGDATEANALCQSVQQIGANAIVKHSQLDAFRVACAR